MRLEIDNREPKDIIDIICSQIDNVERTSLEVGDFVIRNDRDEIEIIIERKSLSDLMSSIKDGRYNEQSFRLNECNVHNHNIYYFIEGDLNKYMTKNSELNQRIIFSAIFSLSYFKGFSIIKTNSSIETAEYIIRFYQKVLNEKNKKAFYNNYYYDNSKNMIGENIAQYSEVNKMSKKSHITKDNIGEIMLSQIPGVSIITAQHIMKIYKNITHLINSLKEDTKCLDKLKIDHKNCKRNISKSAIINIKEYLAI